MAGTHQPAALAAAPGSGRERDDRRRPPHAGRHGRGLHCNPAVPSLPAGDGRPGGRKHVIVEAASPDRGQAAELNRSTPGSGHRSAGRQPHAAVQPSVRRVWRLARPGCWGEVLHGFFENYASTRTCRLGTGSGDRSEERWLFVEHGHSSTCSPGGSGPGESRRPRSGSGRGPRSKSTSTGTVRTAAQPLVNSTRFHQAGRMDRQESGSFRAGDVTLSDWVPTRPGSAPVVDEADPGLVRPVAPGRPART